MIIDRHLITGQNDTSTLSAVQNLILLCNARLGRFLFQGWGVVIEKFTYSESETYWILIPENVLCENLRQT